MKGILSSTLIIVAARWPQNELTCHGFSALPQSCFHGTPLDSSTNEVSYRCPLASESITMRKQKASDRRTTRRQRGGEELTRERVTEKLSRRDVTITSSPMARKGEWKLRRQVDPVDIQTNNGGRGRSKKRSSLYNSLSAYHNKFLNYLTEEYKAEVGLVIVERKMIALIADGLSKFPFSSTIYRSTQYRKKR